MLGSLHILQTLPPPSTTPAHLFGVDVSTLLSLTALVATFLYFILKERRTGLTAIVTQFEKRFDDMHVHDLRTDLLDIIDRLSALETKQEVMTTNMTEYHAWLMDGGLKDVLSRLASAEERVDTVVTTVSEYVRYMEQVTGVKDPPNVLIVEDNPVDAALILRYFADVGVSGILDVVDSGERALAFLNDADKDTPDMILLDLELPGISGAKVLRVIREDAKFCGIPVVVTTGASPDCVDTEIAAMADLVVHKPVDVGTLMKRYRQMCGGLRRN